MFASLTDNMTLQLLYAQYYGDVAPMHVASTYDLMRAYGYTHLIFQGVSLCQYSDWLLLDAS